MISISNALLKYKVTRFQGTQRVTFGDVYNFERTDSWSVSLWVRTTTVAGGILVGRQMTADTFPGWGLFINPGSIFWRIGFGSTVTQAASISGTIADLQDGHWHHIVATYDGSSNASGLVIYHNGQAVSSSVVSNNLASSILNTAPFQIAARNSFDSFYRGDLQDVALFSGVLSAGDAVALYNRAVPPDILDLTLSAGTPLSYWILGEHVGDVGPVADGVTDGVTVPDLGSNGFDGTTRAFPSLVTRGCIYPLGDLRSVISSVTCRAYWRSDDLQMIGSLGTLQRMERFNGGDSTGGGDITPSGNIDRVVPIRLTITNSGGYGVGRFNLSYDGNVTIAMTDVLIQASVPLTGMGVGTNVLFQNTSYTVGNVFENVMGFLPDRSGNSRNITLNLVNYLNGNRIRPLVWPTGATIPQIVTELDQYCPPAAVTMPSPGSSPTYISAMIKQSTITGSDERSFCLGSNTNSFRVWLNGDGQVAISNGTNRVWGSYTFTKWNVWIRLRAYFSNSSNDFLQLGGDSTNFPSAGNSSDSSFRMGRAPAEERLGSAGNQTIAEFSIWNGLPDELEAEDNYYATLYDPNSIIA